jgi:hypothetical protein
MAKVRENTRVDGVSDNKLQSLSTYNEGKMRRYSLLFTVNGGAFAIAKLLGEPQGGKVLGGLSLDAVAIGAVVFTCLMWLDIFTFGQMMRRKVFGIGPCHDLEIKTELQDFWSGKEGKQDELLIFGALSKFVLGALCTLLILGWTVAAFGLRGALLALLVIVVTLAVLANNRKKGRAAPNSTGSTQTG